MSPKSLAPENEKRATMRDVASLARVSVQTVSNVVNGRGHLMTPKTRARVERAMVKVNYHPHLAARTLRSGRTQALGFLVLDEHTGFLADPLTDLMLAGVGDVARDRGYGVLIQGRRPSVLTLDLFTPLLEKRVDGAFLILSGEIAVRSWYLERLAELGMPFVVFDEPVDAPTGLSVMAMNRQGARRLTEHLIGRGHRRIAFIAARVPWPVIEERHHGYRQALHRAEIPVSPELELFEGGLDASGGAEMAARLLELEEPPTAIMATSDLLAAGALVCARERGYRVPADVAVTGFDDFLFASLTAPPLTTIRVPGYEMGKIAAEMLIDRLEGHEPQSQHIVLPVDLCERGST